MKCRFPLTVLMRKKETSAKCRANDRDGTSSALYFPIRNTVYSHQLYVFDLRCRILEHANPLLFIITKHRLFPFRPRRFPPQKFQSEKLPQLPTTMISNYERFSSKNVFRAINIYFVLLLIIHVKVAAI